MEKSKQYQEIIALGKKIVSEFKLEEQKDTTLKWMANYIAELTIQGENEQDVKKKKEIQKECAEIILMLWAKRANFFGNARPLAKIDNLLKVIDALKEEKRVFDWDRFDTPENIGDWSNLIKKIRADYNDVINIALCCALVPDAVTTELEWSEFKKLLSKEETEILKRLEFLLSKTNSFLGIVVKEENSEEVEITRKEQIINRLNELISKQNSTLEKLKSIINNQS